MQFKITQVYDHIGAETLECFYIKIYDLKKSDVDRLRPMIEKIQRDHMEEDQKEHDDWEAEAEQRRILNRMEAGYGR